MKQNVEKIELKQRYERKEDRDESGGQGNA